MRLNITDRPIDGTVEWNILYIIDWHAVGDEDVEEDDEEHVEKDDEEPKRKKPKRVDHEAIYQQLKNSYIDNPPSEYTEFHDVKSIGLDEKQMSLENIKKLDQIIKGYKCKGTKYYSQLGNELAKYKVHFLNKCGDCKKRPIEDGYIYKILDCSKCLKASKSSNIKQYFEDMKTTINYGKSHISHLINLGKLGVMYPKFMNTTIPSGKMKSNLKYIRERMEEESNFWKSSTQPAVGT